MNSESVERALLSSVFMQPDSLLEIAGTLTEEQFSTVQHRAIFKAMNSMLLSNKAIDPVTLSSELARNNDLDVAGGEVYLTGLISDAPVIPNMDQYADEISRAHSLRHIIDCTKTAMALAQDSGADPEDIAASLISELSRTKGREKQEVYLRDILIELTDAGRSKEPALTTGYDVLDEILGGWHGGELYLVAARTSVGKSALLLRFADWLAKQGWPLLFVSREMSQSSMAERLLGAQAKVNTAYFRNAKAPEYDLSRIPEAMMDLGVGTDKYPFIFTETVFVEALASQCKRLIAQTGIRALFVDYAQLMKTKAAGRGASRFEQVGIVSNSLKHIAQQNNIPVLAAAQLNRAATTGDQSPGLVHLRESGSLEQDADVVLILSPDFANDNMLNLSIAKNRNGRSGAQLQFLFDRRYGTFEHIAREW